MAQARSGGGGRQRFYGIQVLRGVAAVLVVLHHELEFAMEHVPGSPHPRWMDNGAFGVDIFFPISGFVMYFAARSLMRRAGRWQEFAWRRLVRVAPLYWIFTTLKVLLAVLVPAVLTKFVLIPWNVAGSYLFVPMRGEMGAPLPVLPVGWTLNFEAFFYVLVAVAIAWRLPLLRWVGAGLAAAAVLGFLVPRGWGAWTILGDPVVLEFLGGMLLARFADRVRRTPAWLAGLLVAAGAGYALLVPISGLLTFSPMRVLAWGVPGAAIVWGVLALEDRVRMERWRPALLLGDASYSLYLTHTFVLPGLAIVVSRVALRGGLGLAGFSVVSLLACLVVALGVHWWVELPMLRWMEGWRVSWVVRSAESGD